MSVSRYKKLNFSLAGIFILLIVVAIGCGKSGNPLAPGAGSSGQMEITVEWDGNMPANRFSMGFWDIEIDVENMTAEIIPARQAELHFNILHMLEGWACLDCVYIPHLEWSPQGTLLVDLAIRHPFPPDRLDITAHDTRGILIFDADPGSFFPLHTVRNKFGDEVPLSASRIIMNPDGYTTHYNRETSFEGYMMSQYLRGRMTPPEEKFIVGNLHPYKLFFSHEQGMLLYPGHTVVQTYELDVKQFTYFRFGYSVDACWQMPLTWPVTNPYTDFAKSANSLEPYQLSINILSNNLTRHGGTANILIDVYDHQGFDTISSISIESPDLFTGRMDIDPNSYLWDSYPITRYQVAIQNKAGYGNVEQGGSDILVVVEDIAMSVVGDDYRAYNIWRLPVVDVASAWRPRQGSFLNLPFPGPSIDNINPDLTVVANPDDYWAIVPGESLIIFKDDNSEKYIACNRDFDTGIYLAGYPGAPSSWLKPTRRIDAAAGGAFGVLSDSNTVISGEYRVKNCTAMHIPVGVFNTCWYTGSLDDPFPYLELGGDVSGGFGLTFGDPIYTIFIYDDTAGYGQPPMQSLHRIADPYYDPYEAFRAMIPLQDIMTGEMPPFQYGVSYPDFVAMGINDQILGITHQFTADIYTIEDRTVTPISHQREMDIYRIDFTSPFAYSRIRTYTNNLLGTSAPWPGLETPEIVDVDVLPAFVNQVSMGLDTYPEHNWVAVLYTFGTAQWFIEIFDVYDDLGPFADGWKTPLYTVGPYNGHAFAMDVDPENFEIYVLQDDLPFGTGNVTLTCLEYY